MAPSPWPLNCGNLSERRKNASFPNPIKKHFCRSWVVGTTIDGAVKGEN